MEIMPEHQNVLYYSFQKGKLSLVCINGIMETGNKRTSQYRKTSSIRRTKSQNLNVSCIPLQLSSLNPLKPGVKMRRKM